MSALEVLAVVGIAVYIVQSSRLISAVSNVRQSIDLFALRFPVEENMNHHTAYKRDMDSSQYVIWMWTGGRWELDETSVPKGAKYGAPPKNPGVYEGECVKCPI